METGNFKHKKSFMAIWLGAQQDGKVVFNYQQTENCTCTDMRPSLKYIPSRQVIYSRITIE